MISTANTYMVKLVPESKSNKSLMLILANIKANSSILMKLKVTRIPQKTEMSYFHFGSKTLPYADT